MAPMGEVSIRELRHRGGDIVDRAARGEPITITRDGRPVAELHATRRVPLTAAELIARRRHLPAIDPTRLRADLDATIDASL